MSFDANTHNTQEIAIDKSDINLSVWIRNYTTSALNTSVATAFTVRDGNFNFHLALNENDSNALIHGLHQHIANIKAAEIELIALNTKAAA